MTRAREAGDVRSLQAYPNIRTAARILGINQSTLSRRADINVEARGERDRALTAVEVLRLGTIFRRRSLNDVAYDLLELARKRAPEEAGRVQEEIQEYFESEVTDEQAREQLVTLAHGMLSAALCEQIEAELGAPRTSLPDVIQGYGPMPEG